MVNVKIKHITVIKMKKLNNIVIVCKMSANKDEQKYGWYGVNLPHRECSGTYQMYNKVPKIEVAAEYKDVTDFQKLADFLHSANKKTYLFASPTDCFFELDANSGVFYCDSQGCILWVLEDDGKIVTSNNICVAKSLPEFLTRIELENAIWFKTWLKNEPLTEKEAKYVEALYQLSD